MALTYSHGFRAQRFIWRSHRHSLRQVTRLPLETHLMISDPDFFLDEFVEAGSDSFLVHWEGNNNLHRTAVPWDLVQTFLADEFSQAERHLRRLGKVTSLEAGKE